MAASPVGMGPNFLFFLFQLESILMKWLFSIDFYYYKLRHGDTLVQSQSVRRIIYHVVQMNQLLFSICTINHMEYKIYLLLIPLPFMLSLLSSSFQFLNQSKACYKRKEKRQPFFFHFYTTTAIFRIRTTVEHRFNEPHITKSSV